MTLHASRPHGEAHDSSSLDDDRIENESFCSYYSSMGRAQGASADLESIAHATVSARNSEVGSFDASSVTVWSMAKRFAVLGFPLSLSALSQFSFNAAIISVLGRYLGVEQMGGGSLALGLVNATGFAFGAGLCGALETVLSHTFGRFTQAVRRGEASDNDTIFMYGIYAQRMALILLVAAIPLGVVMCFADTVLTAVGESEDVTYYTGVWCRVGMYGIPLAMMVQLVQRYYSCQHITKPLSVTMVTAAIINPFLQIFFVHLFGLAGSAIAWMLLLLGINVGLIGYLRQTGIYKKTWGGWSPKAMKHIYPLAKIALPSMGVMLSEWVALEINFLAAGFASPNDLAGYAITFQIFGIIWGIGSGVIILTCVFVGNAVGEGQPLLARRIAFMAIGFVFAISIFDCVVLLLVGPWLPYLFTKDPEVVAVYKSLMYIVLPYHVLDTFQSVVMGILRGCGLQRLGAIIITTAFCVVGVPLSFLLFFHFDIGVKALWIGPFLGALFVGFPSYIYLLLRYIDWAALKTHDTGDNQDPQVTITNLPVPGSQQNIQEYLDNVASTNSPDQPPATQQGKV